MEPIIAGSHGAAGPDRRAARNEARRAARNEAKERAALVMAELLAAEQEVNGGPIGSLACVLVGPFGRQDPALARRMVRDVLMGRGMAPGAADAAIDRLLAASQALRDLP